VLCGVHNHGCPIVGLAVIAGSHSRNRDYENATTPMEEGGGNAACFAFGVIGQVGKDSNLQPVVLETTALPIELPT
jgi:hypothetical protein